MHPEIWERWRSTYRADEARRLVEDGYYDEALYRAAPKRIVVVLKETNSRDGRYDGAKLSHQLRNGAEGPIWHRVGEWAAGFHQDFPGYSEICSRRVLNGALRQVAVLNLKKIPGSSSVKDHVIHAAAFRDRVLLREQFEHLAPDVILACGTFKAVCWLLHDKLPRGADLGDVVNLEGGARLVRWSHPSRRGKRKGVWYNELADRWNNATVEESGS